VSGCCCCSGSTAGNASPLPCFDTIVVGVLEHVGAAEDSPVTAPWEPTILFFLSAGSAAVDIDQGF
jgi:hypothetical protein